ncbi:MAG: YlxR family protein [Lachnospiraceae bacterium]|nr:YlxR family protein [Lachnospiraceae bacterium]
MTITKKENPKAKRIPIRRCIACNKRIPKKDLIRIGISSGHAQIDDDGRLMSRGVYLCKDKECIDKAGKKDLLKRCLKIPADEIVYKELYDKI